MSESGGLGFAAAVEGVVEVATVVVLVAIVEAEAGVVEAWGGWTSSGFCFSGVP